ncbi:MAG: DNA mismatch repair protein MutS [Flavobacteriales bacterium]
MKQYQAIKAKYPDALLLFRVGDFYETFGRDAVKAARILDIVLTKRANGAASEMELAGFPHHALNTYLQKLVRAGERVAICDQLEDPKTAKSVVKRGVTELVTPGVALNDAVLPARSNNFLAALHFAKHALGIAFLDLSTGEFLVSEGRSDYILKLLQSLQPVELIYQRQCKAQTEALVGERFYTYRFEDWAFQPEMAREKLLQHFQTSSLKGFGVADLEAGITAAGAILSYLGETRHADLKHIIAPARIEQSDFVWMDDFTIQNLELYTSPNPNAVTLLDVIDQTVSPMGARMLKRWLALPLKTVEAIQRRCDAVGELRQDEKRLAALQDELRSVADLERLASKIATRRITPREINQLKASLRLVPGIQNKLVSNTTEALCDISTQLLPLESLTDLIAQTLQRDAPVALGKGGAIAKGVSEELDELRKIAFSTAEYLEELVARERRKTGIPSLKIAFNNVFGYYLEVRNTYRGKVPESWIRKQTLVSAERYITDELKAYETKILGAQEKIEALEAELYANLIVQLQEYLTPIQQNAKQLAQLDVLLSFAESARLNRYTRPQLTADSRIRITQGRHPVVEKQLPPGEAFIANDVYLDPDEQQIIVITGPNMSGKSAVLRQTALIVLLAQIGSYVPAEQAQIGVVDKIFTRVGASDNISLGESTFMVEMNETASILNNLSERSLILLDEIGRGTSTYDGISIAWAIAAFLHESPKRPKTLFATHYHELNEMTKRFPRIKNYNVSVKEYGDQIVFMRKLVAGGSNHSFGIHVAQMAGMPIAVTRRAAEILKTLEGSNRRESRVGRLKAAALDRDMQLGFFQLDDPVLQSVRAEIQKTDIDALTPVAALMKLHELKKMIEK